MQSTYHLSVIHGDETIRVIVVELRPNLNRRTHTRHELLDVSVTDLRTTSEELLEHLAGAIYAWAQDAERRADPGQRAVPSGVLDTITDARLWD